MQIKVAFLLISLLAVASGKPHLETKTTKSIISTISYLLREITELTGVVLNELPNIIANIHDNADAIKNQAEADAAGLIAAAKQAIVNTLTTIQGEVEADAAKTIQCALDQQDTLEEVVNETNNAIIESVASNLYGIGDYFIPIIDDLKEANLELLFVEVYLAECEISEDQTNCVLGIIEQVLDILATFLENVEDSLDPAVAAIQAAAEKIGADTDVVKEKLKQAVLQILSDIGTCAAA